MKSANVKIRRMTAVVLMLLAGLLMCITGLLPSEARAEETSTTISTTSNQFSSILDQNITESVDEDISETPYGIEKNQAFMLSTENELLVLSSHDMQTSEGTQNARYYDNTNNGAYAKDSTTSADNVYQALAFSETVAFDATGSGRNDHVAYVGYDQTAGGGSGSIVMYVVNTRADPKSISDKIELDSANWLEKAKPMQYQAMNCFSITAGDYDGDGKDTVVVYSCGDGKNLYLYEYSFEDTKGKPTVEAIKSKVQNSAEEKEVGNGPFNPAYFTAKTTDNKNLYDVTSEIMKYRLGVCLATGDMNGDGLDDLGVVSYCNWIPDNDYAIDNNLGRPYLWVGFGSESQSVQGMLDNTANSNHMYVQKANTGTTLYEPTISFGDINGDGKENLVMAGYQKTLTNTEYGTDPAKTEICWFSTKEDTNFYETSGFYEVESNQLTANKSGAEDNGDKSDKAAAPVATACVAINGQASAEFVFVNGTLYDLSAGSASELTTISYIEEDGKTGDFGENSTFFSRAMIQSVAVGNFNGNDAGREQVYCTIGGQNDTSDDNYCYYVCSIYGTEYQDLDSAGKVTTVADNIVQYGTAKNYDSSDSDNFWGNRGKSFGSANEKRLSCNVVAIDNDNDGVKAKYLGRQTTYTDPQVTAVLQAAPWFSELGTYGDFQGTTSYGITRTYGSGTTSSTSGSVGIGVSAEITTPAVTVSLESGYARGYTSEFEKNITTSYTDQFTAGSHDSVVISRTPVYLYSYEIESEKTNDGSAKTGAITYSVPQLATYYQLSVDDYNQFVKEYNAKVEEFNTNEKISVDKYNEGKLPEEQKTATVVSTLNELSDKYLQNEGNPYGYRKNWNDTDEKAKQLSQSRYALGYNGSTTGSTFSKSVEETFTKETSNTYTTSASISIGWESPTTGIGAQAGVTASSELATSKGTYTSTGSEEETSGTVYNIDQQELLNSSGIAYNTSAKYGFLWTYGMWFKDLGTDNSNIPVYGYALTEIKSPAPPVTDLQAGLESDSTVRLTWSKPDTSTTDSTSTDKKRADISGYQVYQINDNGDYTKLGDALTDTTTEYVVEGLTSNTTYRYVVTAISTDGESFYSNEASVTTPKQNLAVSLKVVDSATGLPSEGAVITANHLGNVAISDGDLVPETSIINVGITAADGNTIDSITMTSGSDSSTMPASFSFSLKEPTEIVVKVTGEPVVTVTESKVSYQARTIGADDKDMTPGSTGGSVTAAIGNVPLSSGGKVAMPNAISFNATANEGYVLKEWRIYRSSDDYTNDENPVIRPNDGTMSLSYSPTTDTTIVTPIFIDVNNPAAYKTVTIDQTTGGTVTASDASDQELVPDENGQIKVFTGNTVTFTAEAAEYYNFTGWAGNIEGAGTENPTTLNVTQDITAKASFVAPVTYTVEYESCTAKAGDVTVKNGSSQIPGTEVTFTAPAVEGKYVSQWVITDNGAGTSETIDTPVDEIIESVGQKKTCTLTVTHNISVKPVYAERTTISNVDVNLTVIANSDAQTRFEDTANHYTAEITWLPELDDGKFDYDTIYTAEIVVTPESALYQIDATGSGYKVSGSTDGVTCSNGSTESITMTKTFEKTDRDYSVKGVTISQDSLTIDSAGDAQLTAAVTPDYATKQSINWTSSDDSVATVDQNGKVTAHKAGTATITAASEENSSISADCIVTVINPTVTYRAHVQNYGWLSDVTNGAQAGTTGQALQMEAIVVNAATSDGTRIPLKIDAHLADIGWINGNTDNRIVGTTGQYRRLEAVRIYINDSELDAKYDIYYRMHVRNYGWMNWEKDGGVSGTTGQALRAEAIEIMILPAGQTPE